MREDFNDYLAFLAVAQERSFTRAAARMNISQSTLSHIIRNGHISPASFSRHPGWHGEADGFRSYAS